MTAGELIGRCDALRPNAYTQAEKLRWLQRLDGQIRRELLETHEDNAENGGPLWATAPTPEASENAVGADSIRPQTGPYDGDTVLLAGEPYGEEVYLSYLFAQIDLHNAEIEKYDQSAVLFAAAWRALADDVNRRTKPKGRHSFQF